MGPMADWLVRVGEHAVCPWVPDTSMIAFIVAFSLVPLYLFSLW
jgi:hypothetical protein